MSGIGQATLDSLESLCVMAENICVFLGYVFIGAYLVPAR
jgi:hypothetical protein